MLKFIQMKFLKKNSSVYAYFITLAINIIFNQYLNVYWRVNHCMDRIDIIKWQTVSNIIRIKPGSATCFY